MSASKVALSNSVYVISIHHNPVMRDVLTVWAIRGRNLFPNPILYVQRHLFFLKDAKSYFSLRAKAAAKRAQKICSSPRLSFAFGLFQTPCVREWNLDDLKALQNGGSVGTLLPTLHAFIYAASSYFASGCFESTLKARVDHGAASNNSHSRLAK